MDILDQVAQLLSDMEQTERKRHSTEEIGKAILLHAATGEYLERVRNRNWRAARDRLVRIMLAVVNMIPDLPDDARDG